MAAHWAAHGSEPGLDEFTVPAEKSRLLEGSLGRIEGLFEVRLAVLGAQGDWRPAILPPGPPSAAARIWVQLTGGGKAVRSAKVRGEGNWGQGGKWRPGVSWGPGRPEGGRGPRLPAGRAPLSRGRAGGCLARVGGRKGGGRSQWCTGKQERSCLGK